MNSSKSKNFTFTTVLLLMLSVNADTKSMTNDHKIIKETASFFKTIQTKVDDTMQLHNNGSIFAFGQLLKYGWSCA